MDLVLVTGPTTEPISLQEAKDHLRVTVSDEDTLIQSYIKAARGFAEAFLRRALMPQTWELCLDAFPSGSEIQIPNPPLRSVVSVKYTTKDGIETTLDPATYMVNTKKEPGRLVLAYGKGWPSAALSPSSPVIIRFEAGYADAATIPEPIKQAIKVMVADQFENREPSDQSRPSNFAFESLLWPYRVLGW